MRMKTIRIDSFVVSCACLGTLFIGGMWLQQERVDVYQQELAHERNLRKQAERIEYKLIQEAADVWCSDHVDDLWASIRQCEEKDVNRINGCQECWDAWTFDMEGSCRTMMHDFEYKAEDTMLAMSARALWADYSEARSRDCEGRGFDTVEAYDKCLGPAARQKEIQDALDAMLIHQQSKSF